MIKTFSLVLLAAASAWAFDDYPDVATTDLDGLWTFAGDGEGGFAQPEFLAVSACDASCPEPWALAAGDLNGNGTIDVVSANRLQDHLTLHFGNGDGTFHAAVVLPTDRSPYDVDLADLDNDGDLELAVACNYNPGSVQLFYNDGFGEFADSLFLSPGREPFNCELADYNGDGWMDLAVTNNADDTFSVYLNNKSGVPDQPVVFSAGDDPKPIKSGHFNGDGFLDLVLANYDAGQVRAFLGDGEGGFTFSKVYTTLGNPRDLAVADLDRDGIADVMVAAGRGADYVSRLLGSETGIFSGPVNFTTGPRPNGIDTADFDFDGNLDVVVANWSFDEPGLASMTLLLGDGEGNFPEARDFLPAGGFRKITTLVAGQFNAYRFRRGDASLDGKININDPIRILKFLFSNGKAPCQDAVDIDDNGSVDLTDAVGLLEFLFINGKPPAPPFSTPGIDATPDRLPCNPD